MILQKETRVGPFSRGFHIITEEINQILSTVSDFETGFAHIFIKHTSASLSINENADPSVRKDMESWFNKNVEENLPYYTHTFEGPDDMPAHIKSSLLDISLVIPVTNGRLNLGTWQGIYLCEHRNNASSRSLVITIYGE